MNNKKRVAMGYVFLLPALILFMVVVAYPVFNTLKTSFYSIRVQNIATGGKWVGLANYKQLIQDPNTWVTLKFTLLFTVVSVILEIVIGMGCALIMNIGMRGEGIVRGCILVPWCIPTIVSGLMWSYMFAESYGIINQLLQQIGMAPVAWLTNSSCAFWAVVISDVWKTAPYMGLLLLAGLKTVPLNTMKPPQLMGQAALQSFSESRFPALSRFFWYPLCSAQFPVSESMILLKC